MHREEVRRTLKLELLQHGRNGKGQQECCVTLRVSHVVKNYQFLLHALDLEKMHSGSAGAASYIFCSRLCFGSMVSLSSLLIY